MPGWVRGIPIIGVFLRYLNLYVGKGEVQFLENAAPRHLWLDRFLVQVAINGCLAGIFWLVLCNFGDVEKVDLSGLINSVFPSLLGFGIGVFALIFVIPDDLMGALDKRKTRSGLGSNMMISDMAYPLVYLALGIVMSAVVNLLVNSPFSDFIQLFVFLYGLTLVFDLIGVIAAAALAARFKKTRSSALTEREKLLSKLRRGSQRPHH